MLTDARLELFEAAKWLAQNGTEKVIIKSLIPDDVSKNLASGFYSRNDLGHRYGTHWLRCEDGYTGTRVYRLIMKIYGSEFLQRKMGLVEFRTISEAYFMQFPEDAMSTNRIHYLIQSLLTGDAIVNEKCRTCSKPYVTHRDDCLKRDCPICEMLES